MAVSKQVREPLEKTGTPAQAKKPAAWRTRLSRLQERYTPYWLVLPAILVMAAILLYPLVYSFYISFFDYRLARARMPFIGLDNYINAMTNDAFLLSLVQNLVFTVVCVVVEFITGMALALLLNRNFIGRGVVRALFLLPMLTAPVLAGFNWRWIFNDRFGLLNQLLLAVGLPPQGWLVDANLARLSIVVATVWQGIPFVMLLLLAGLQALPQAPFEAAIVDGASAWQRFRYLTLPLMRPVIVVVLALRIIDLFRVFDVIYIMTFGGPGHATELIPFYVYRSAFSESRVGYASALSWITLLITLLFLVPLFMGERSGAENERMQR
ncbi:MAG: sugar ABC transporter permease [Caldilineaceae bacterium]